MAKLDIEPGPDHCCIMSLSETSWIVPQPEVKAVKVNHMLVNIMTYNWKKYGDLHVSLHKFKS